MSDQQPQAQHSVGRAVVFAALLYCGTQVYTSWRHDVAPQPVPPIVDPNGPVDPDPTEDDDVASTSLSVWVAAANGVADNLDLMSDKDLTDPDDVHDKLKTLNMSTLKQAFRPLDATLDGAKRNPKRLKAQMKSAAKGARAAVAGAKKMHGYSRMELEPEPDAQDEEK